MRHRLIAPSQREQRSGNYANINKGCATGPCLSGGSNAAGNFPVGQGVLAFPGKNPDFGQVLLLEPVGRSVYNGLDVVLRSDLLKSPVSFVHRLNAQISYSLSRYNAQASDGDFVNSALDFNNPSKFIGPNGLDRTHQFSAGVVMDLPAGIPCELHHTLLYGAPADTDLFRSGKPGGHLPIRYDG